MEQRLKESAIISAKTSGKVDEPQFKAMFKMAAKVLGGLTKAGLSAEKRKGVAALACPFARLKQLDRVARRIFG
jgi:hypothetical protein